MKKFISLICIFLILFMTGCTSTIGIIGGSDGPTSIMVAKGNNQGQITPVRLINVEGSLYFDTGLSSKLTARCGTLDGGLKKTVSEYEIPKNNGDANFSAKNDKYFGYQHATSISKELPLDEDWIVFKKIDEKNLTRYKYGFFIKGTHPNAKKESTYIILSNTMDITFEMITKYFFSSQLKDHMIDIAVIHPKNYDEWGILMYADNVTKKGITLYLEQFGGNYKGELQTGSAYTLEVYENDSWNEVETISGTPLVWNAMAYMIKENEKTEFTLDFSFGFNELKKGRYRVGKEIMDFIEPSNFTERTYYAEFEIKE